MTDKEIARMAREAGIPEPFVKSEQVKRFAALVAEAEREACAKVAEEYKEDCYDGDSEWYAANTILNEIKARGKE